MPRPKLTAPAAMRRYVRHRGEVDPRERGRLAKAEAALRHCYPRLPATRFGGRQLKRVRAYLTAEQTSHWTGEPLSRSYVNNIVHAITRAWRWLLSESLVSAQRVGELRAVGALRYGQGGREPARVGPPREGWDRVLHHLTYTVRAMVLVHVCGGMRSQDVCRMRRGDISTIAGERVEFPGTGRYAAATRIEGVPVWVYVPRKHKTLGKGKPRAVPLGPRAQAVLAPLLAGLKPDDHVFQVAQHLKECGKPNQHAAPGRPVSVGVYGAYIARTIRRVNAPLAAAGVPAAHLIPHWSPHQLRHLQATVVGDALDRSHAQALLGHSGPGDVIDRYMEQSLGKAGKAAARCG